MFLFFKNKLNNTVRANIAKVINQGHVNKGRFSDDPKDHIIGIG